MSRMTHMLTLVPWSWHAKHQHQHDDTNQTGQQLAEIPQPDSNKNDNSCQSAQYSVSSQGTSKNFSTQQHTSSQARSNNSNPCKNTQPHHRTSALTQTSATTSKTNSNCPNKHLPANNCLCSLDLCHGCSVGLLSHRWWLTPTTSLITLWWRPLRKKLLHSNCQWLCSFIRSLFHTTPVTSLNSLWRRPLSPRRREKVESTQ